MIMYFIAKPTATALPPSARLSVAFFLTDQVPHTGNHPLVHNPSPEASWTLLEAIATTMKELMG